MNEIMSNFSINDATGCQIVLVKSSEAMCSYILDDQKLYP